jgi:murein DD-endopeptidase MepM/ murein hydrolase activator NlpD
MTPRLTPSLALAAAILAAGCVEQRESAPIVFRGGAPAPSGQVATATPPIESRPLDAAPATSAAVPAAAAADGAGVIDYGGYRAVVARSGDTVESIAARAGVSASALASYNGLPAGYAPRAGDELILPPSPRVAGAASAPLSSPAPVASAPLSPAAPPAPARQGGAASTFDVADIEAAIGGSRAQPTARPEAQATAAIPDPAPILEPTEAPAADPETDPRVAALEPAAPEAPAPEAVAPEPVVPAPAATPPQSAATAPRFSNPVDGPIVRPYSRAAGATRNDGVDFGAAAGAPVRAAADGQVALVSESLGGLGTIVLIRHANEILTVYGRVDSVSVKKGDRVSRGQSIGAVAPAADGGNPTMHFEVRRGADSVDPADFLPG